MKISHITVSTPRNLRPEPTSYGQTGIPCGNPQRYKSRGVTRMCRHDAVPYEDQRLGEPGEGTETEAEQQLKRMLQNQLDTDVTLESQKKKQKTFTSSSTYNSCNPDATGTLSLRAYQSLEERSEYEEKLRQYGLTDDEIKYKLELKGMVPKEAKRSNYGADPLAEKQRLEELKKKIEDKEKALSAPDSFSNVHLLSRHAMEVEMSLNRGTERAKDFKHLVQVSSTVDCDNDPVLQTLLSNTHLLGDRTSLPKIHRPPSSKKTTLTEEGNNPECVELSSSYSKTCLGEATKNTFVLPEITSIEESEILHNRLSIDEIKQIPRFKDYAPGEPSKTLFLKNLSNKVKEEDLIRLFLRFQQNGAPKLVFRLMKGRMKGQAFVTFPDSEVAIKAHSLVNGYRLKGRPVIIEFGRKREKAQQRDSEIHLN
ncbi:RNA-binding protein 41 isoform X1 [Nematostella vectensis]|uniref:RNA-binding protein 41 isoform X1 n=1 Tax=Nematostella vectensis TaxID=45351 RepID=UPI0020777D25|nr:RNA-binding protein 41 isoform X1 [Nematostella vectensis]